MAKCKLAVDLDGAVTNIYMAGSGLVLSEPTVATVSAGENAEIKAFGEEAKKMIGKTAKNSRIVFPVFEGEIVNEKVAAGVLGGFLDKIEAGRGIFGAQAIFALPCGFTREMLDKYVKVAKLCGISKTYFAESPILSALGQRIPLSDSTPCFIIDMAGGVTNVAAVSLDGVIAGVSVNYGLNDICSDVIDYIAETFGLQTGLLTAERIIKEIGSLDPDDGLKTVVNGRDTSTGTPRALSLKAVDIIKPVKRYYDKIAEIAKTVLKKLLPEVSAEVRRSGLFVAGIGSEIYGLKNYYSEKFGIPVKIAENGRYAVAIGGGVAMGSAELLKKITVKNV